MTTYDVAFVGTGDPDAGFAMAYHHAAGYQQLEDCRLVACADLVHENARRFAVEHDVPEEHAFADHDAMLDAVDVDVVSVCVPPAAHAPVVIDAAEAGVAAVHCEKPMADTWGAAREMAAVADREGVQLTFNHQRRFGTPWRAVKALLDDGAIGDLERIETSASNLYDWGTHVIDLANMYADEADVEWVLGQLDYREENRFFGEHCENQALATWRYETGVDALAATGRGADLVGCKHRLVGTEGTIEVEVDDGPPLRYRRHGDGEWTVDDRDDAVWTDVVHRAVGEVIDALGAGRESQLRAENALRATEVIFGAYESARRRGRVDVPLEIEDNPLSAMVERGDLTPEPAGE